MSQEQATNSHGQTKPMPLAKPKMHFYLNVSLIGALRGGLCLFIEHPLESIKTQWQDNSSVKSTKEIVKNIYTQKGLIGFYRGFLPNFIRVTSKHFYRWPLMLFFPRYYDKHLPTNIHNLLPGLNKILTGLSIANLEILILCPLDRLKIFFMTSKFLGSNSSKINYFYNSHKKNLFAELFRGIEPTFWRSNVSWVSFLYLDYKLKSIFKKLRNSDYLTFLDLFFVSIFVGAGNLLAMLPFDFVKTQLQKEEFIQAKTFPILRKYYIEGGMKLLYTGWQFKMLQYITQSFFTVFTLDRLEMKSKKV